MLHAFNDSRKDTITNATRYILPGECNKTHIKNLIILGEGGGEGKSTRGDI